MASGFYARCVMTLVAVGLLPAFLGCKVKSETRTYSFEPKCTAKDESCADDKTARLCVGDGKALIPCLGSDGCKKYDTGVSCDQSKARVGDACVRLGSKRKETCSEDERSILECKSGAWTELGECSKRCVHKHTPRSGLVLPKDWVECE